MGRAVGLLGRAKQPQQQQPISVLRVGGSREATPMSVAATSPRAALDAAGAEEQARQLQLADKLGVLRRQCSSWEQFQDLERRMFHDEVGGTQPSGLLSNAPANPFF
eukprot:SAG22_NODE_3052_length_1982_cov_2.076474_2_plen_107_part_00